MTFDDVRPLALALPGVAEGSSYGAPAFRVNGRVLACQPANPRLREGTLVLFDVEPDEREALVAGDPDVFFFTDHYRDYPAVLVRLQAVTPERLRPYLERSWRLRAPRRRVRAREG